jgi:hypothetical protein
MTCGAKAPLREDIAFALLQAAGFRKGMALLDPFCGSGTIAIEVENDLVTTPPINPGAELAVFDTTGIEEGGRFPGVVAEQFVEVPHPEEDEGSRATGLGGRELLHHR